MKQSATIQTLILFRRWGASHCLESFLILVTEVPGLVAPRNMFFADRTGPA